MKKRFCLIATLFMAIIGFGQAKKTLLIIVDGIPADVIEKLELPSIDRIAREGGYTRAYIYAHYHAYIFLMRKGFGHIRNFSNYNFLGDHRGGKRRHAYVRFCNN